MIRIRSIRGCVWPCPLGVAVSVGGRVTCGLGGLVAPATVPVREDVLEVVVVGVAAVAVVAVLDVVAVVWVVAVV
jgi:hypothetical protein